MTTAYWFRKVTLALTALTLVVAIGTRQAQAQGLNSFIPVTLSPSDGITVTQVGSTFTVSLANPAPTISAGGDTCTLANIFEFALLSDNTTLTTGATTGAVGPTGYTLRTNPGNAAGPYNVVAFFTNNGGPGDQILPGGSKTFTFGSDLTGLAGVGFHVTTTTDCGIFGGGNTGFIRITGVGPSVPEPGTYAAFAVGGLGLLGLMAGARRRRTAGAA